MARHPPAMNLPGDAVYPPPTQHQCQSISGADSGLGVPGSVANAKGPGCVGVVSQASCMARPPPATDLPGAAVADVETGHLAEPPRFDVHSTTVFNFVGRCLTHHLADRMPPLRALDSEVEAPHVLAPVSIHVGQDYPEAAELGLRAMGLHKKYQHRYANKSYPSNQFRRRVPERAGGAWQSPWQKSSISVGTSSDSKPSTSGRADEKEGQNEARPKRARRKGDPIVLEGGSALIMSGDRKTRGPRALSLVASSPENGRRPVNSPGSQKKGVGGRPAAKRNAALGTDGAETKGDHPHVAPATGTAAQFSQLLIKVKRAVQRLQAEEHKLLALGADGWRGASREKVRLSNEIDRSHQQVEQCKETIRECLHECDEPQGYNRRIPEAAFDEEGELEADQILCALCEHQESYDDNDIILCDGSCNRAYHEKCLDPPLVAADLPEDEGWLCPACDCKADILDFINDALDLDYPMEVMWHEVLPEDPATKLAGLDGFAGAGSDLEDRDNADGKEGRTGCSDESSSHRRSDDGEGEGDDVAVERSRTRRPPQRRAALAAAVAGNVSVHPAAAGNGFLSADLPSEDEEDEDFDVEKGEGEEEEEEEQHMMEPGGRRRRLRSHPSRGGRDRRADEGESNDEGERQGASDGDTAGSNLEMDSDDDGTSTSGLSDSPDDSDCPSNSQHLGTSGSDSEEGGDDEGKSDESDGGRKMEEERRKRVRRMRRRKSVDYVALHAEMFGGSPNGAAPGAEAAQSESDEDFSPDSDDE